MQEFLGSLPTMAVNAGVFIGMIIVTVLGGKLAQKAKEPTVTAVPSAQAVVGGVTLQDNMTVMMAAEANRVLAERVGTNTHCIERNTDEMKELRACIDTLIRALDRKND